MNTMQKMRRSNMKARKKLTELGFTNIQMFPHTRWSKDIHLEEIGFDGFCYHNKGKDRRICLFQVKSNQKPSKAVLRVLYNLSDAYSCICLWINCPDRKPVEVYGL